MNQFYYILIFAFIASCSPANKLRRAQRLIDKAELQGAQWAADTVFKEVEVIVKEIQVDSTFVIVPGDSVTIFRDRVEVKIKRLAGDTIFVDAACLPDTIKVKVPVNVYRTITAKGWLRWWMLVVAFIVGAILGRFVIRLLV